MRVLGAVGGWRVVAEETGELILDSPWAGERASLSRPADVARLLAADADPAAAGAAVASLLAEGVSLSSSAGVVPGRPREACPLFVALWEDMSAAAWGRSSEELVQRSAAEWSEASELEDTDPAAAARCVARGEIWEALSEGLSVSDAWERVVDGLGEFREFMSSERGVEVLSVVDMCRPAGCPPWRRDYCPPACG